MMGLAKRVVLLSLAAVAFGAACSSSGSGISQKDLDAAKAETAQKQKQVDDLTQQNTTLQTSLAQVQAQLTTKVTDLADAQRKLDALRQQPDVVKQLRDLADQLDADRLLLTDVRKAPPDTRAEATATWTEIRQLAARSDPALVQGVDRITRALPVYFDWSEKKFASFQEQQLTYVLTGANQYPAAVDAFQAAFLGTLIDRINRISNLVR